MANTVVVGHAVGGTTVRTFAGPVPQLPTLKASAGLVAFALVAAARDLDLDFVAHEPAFMVFCDALLGGFLCLEFDEAVAKFELDGCYAPDFAEATLEVGLARLLGQVADVNFVRLWQGVAVGHVLARRVVAAVTRGHAQLASRLRVVCASVVDVVAQSTIALDFLWHAQVADTVARHTAVGVQRLRLSVGHAFEWLWRGSTHGHLPELYAAGIPSRKVAAKL